MWDLSRAVRSSTVLGRAFDGGADGLLDRLPATQRLAEARAFLAGFDDFLDAVRLARAERVGPHRQGVGDPPRGALGAIDRMRLSDDAKSPRARHDASVAERAAVEAVRAGPAGRRRSGAGHVRRRPAVGDRVPRRPRALQDHVHQGGGRDPDVLPRARPPHGGQGVLDRIEQVFMLVASELDRFRHQPATFTEVLREREATYRSLYDIEPVFVGQRHGHAVRHVAQEGRRQVDVAVAGNLLPASPVWRCGVGPGAGLLDPSDPFALEPGDVLSRPTPTRPGRRCSCPPRPWWSTSGRWAATP